MNRNSSLTTLSNHSDSSKETVPNDISYLLQAGNYIASQGGVALNFVNGEPSPTKATLDMVNMLEMQGSKAPAGKQGSKAVVVYERQQEAPKALSKK